MTTTDVGDTPMHRKKVTELTDAELDILLEEKRQRRYSIIKKHEETQEAKRQQENEKAKAELDKQLRIMEKDIGTIDRALERAEGRLNKIRALRLQYEDDFDPSTDT
jgi:septal ring factor EnvC (AmiA/AmiB activator)